MNDTDCEKMMDQYTDYDKKVVIGLIIQVYYFFETHDSIKRYDEKLKSLFANCQGKATGMEGVVKKRRDMDVEFPTLEQSEMFRNILKFSIHFYEHSKLNMHGQLCPKPSLVDIEAKREKLKEINCGGQNAECTLMSE